MILTLLPPASSPALHHPLVFPEPQHARAPLPSSWAVQLTGLHQDGLDIPSSVHALDGSSGWSAIVEECVFELLRDDEGVRIECILVGGGSVVWDTDGGDCAQMLREALHDLAAAKAEVERERAAFLPHPLAPIHHTYPGAGRAEWAKSSDTLALPPPVLGKGAKHKKQRSLLFLSSIVSGLHKLAASASPSPTKATFPRSPSPTRSELSTSPSPTHASFARSTAWTTTLAFLPPARKTPLPVSVARPRSAILHAKARAGVVDAWRRYALGELRVRLGFVVRENEFEGGTFEYDYPRWTAARMLRRTEEWMAWLVQEARAACAATLELEAVGAARPASTALSVSIPVPKPERSASELSGKTLVPQEGEGGREVRVEVGEMMYGEAEELDVDEWEESVSTEASSCTETETETDDSESVHTPVEGEEGAYGFPFDVASARAPQSREDALVDAHPHTPVDVPRSPTPPSSQATYEALSAQRTHLLNLLRSMTDHRATAAQDARSARAVLEVKSRRRAWSARAYLGRAEERLCGLATPVRGSPLARCEPITAGWKESFEEGGGLEVCTRESDLKALFPVEETEEDEVEDLQAISLVGVAGCSNDEDALEDLENGLRPPMAVSSPCARPMPIRVRTQSIYAARHPNASSTVSPPPRISSLDLDVHPFQDRLPPNFPMALGPPPSPILARASLPNGPPLSRTVSMAKSLPSVGSAPHRPSLPPSALLFQPLKPRFESQTKIALVDDGTDADEESSYTKMSVEMEVGVNVRDGWVEGAGVR